MKSFLLGLLFATGVFAEPVVINVAAGNPPFMYAAEGGTLEAIVVKETSR